MTIKNFATFTEIDPNSRITKTATRVTWAALDRNETAYVYNDEGAGYFDGDFTHLITTKMTSLVNGSYVYTWALTNVLNSIRVIDTANGDALGVALLGLTAEVVPTIFLYELDGGTTYTDSYTATLATPYYLKIVRDEAVGAFGTLYCYIYSDATLITLLDTLTLTLHTSKKDFRYIHACNSDNSSATPYPSSGYSENLEILPPYGFIPRVFII